MTALTRPHWRLGERASLRDRDRGREDTRRPAVARAKAWLGSRALEALGARRGEVGDVLATLER